MSISKVYNYVNSLSQYANACEVQLLFSRTSKVKYPSSDGYFTLVTHLGRTWNAVIEDLIRLSELLDDDEEADNVQPISPNECGAAVF